MAIKEVAAPMHALYCSLNLACKLGSIERRNRSDSPQSSNWALLTSKLFTDLTVPGALQVCMVICGDISGGQEGGPCVAAGLWLRLQVLLSRVGCAAQE